jgi:hypothetical protein
MTQGTSALEWLLDYEMRSAARYRRFVSVVMVASASGIGNVGQLLKDYVRTSDEVFDLGAFTTVVMSETDSTGAQRAVERFKRTCSEKCDLRFAVGSYPGDGQYAPEFVTTVYRRLKEAQRGFAGMVINSG